MYSLEDRQRAVDLYIKYDLSAADTVRELGYPNQKSLALWYKEYTKVGKLHEVFAGSYSKYTDQQKRDAVDYYLEHGKSLARTVRAMGYPTKQALRIWVDDLAPAQRKVFKSMAKEGKTDVTFEQKKSAVIDLCSRKGSAEKIAETHGATRSTLYHWKYQLLGGKEMPMIPDDKDASVDDPDLLRRQVAELRDEAKELKRANYRLKMENDILTATAEVLKKVQGIDPRSLSNREKATVIDALRTTYPLNDLLLCLHMAKSSYFYQKNAMALPDKYAEIRTAVRKEFKASDSVYGYRRIHGRITRDDTIVSEKVIRNIMVEEGLAVIKKTTRRYSSYKGEISPEVPNVIERDFSADAPNVKWLTDLTEFHIPAGKVYLSPVIDCFDGMAVSWTIGISPNAELVNTMLDDAISTLDENEHPLVHGDRGCHYRWPGWIQRMQSRGLVRSMSKKGCSPDNSACEGFFGRLKNEFFYGRSWQKVSIDEFIAKLDTYLHWYNEVRIKQSLGYLSPVEYRQSLRLAA
jgi:transposase InsO family protein/transposase-like protein